jgi:hypothetical protein
MKRLHSQEEQHGGEGVPLPHAPPTMQNSFAQLAIEQVTGGGCAPQIGDLIKPPMPKPQVAHDV